MEIAKKDIKITPDLLIRKLTDEEKEKLADSEDNVTFIKEDDNWYVLTPEGAQKFYIIK